MLVDSVKLEIRGYVTVLDITDPDDHRVLVDKMNAIHHENMSLSLARSLSHRLSSGTVTGPIWKMRFGNGASSVNSIDEVTYLPPNTVGQSADLYNPTYEKIVDDENSSNTNVAKNKMEVSHVGGNLYSDVIVTCTLDAGEPAGQDVLDISTSMAGDFVFDEFGLVDYTGNLISHVRHHPVQKSLNRVIQIIYVLRLLVV